MSIIHVVLKLPITTMLYNPVLFCRWRQFICCCLFFVEDSDVKDESGCLMVNRERERERETDRQRERDRERDRERETERQRDRHRERERERERERKRDREREFKLSLP